MGGRDATTATDAYLTGRSVTAAKIAETAQMNWKKSVPNVIQQVRVLWRFDAGEKVPVLS